MLQYHVNRLLFQINESKRILGYQHMYFQSYFSFFLLFHLLLRYFPQYNYLIVTTIFCKRCPSNTIKCEKNTFKCKENHIHNKHQCLETNLTEAELIALHNSIQIDIKNKVINTKYELFTSNYSFIHKRKDLESAVLYDENYKFGNDFNETILRIPDQMNPNFIWSIFILFFISFLASLESYFFKKLSLSQNK